MMAQLPRAVQLDKPVPHIFSGQLFLDRLSLFNYDAFWKRVFLECGNRVAAFSFCGLARADSWQNLSNIAPM
jgi:hypothetical protein